MRLFLALILIAQSVYGAAIWPNGQRLQTFQNGLLFGNNETLDATTDNFTFSGGGTFQGPFVLEQQSTPSNPSSGFNKLYFKSDNNLYKLNESGDESNVSSILLGGQDQSGANFGEVRVPNQQVVTTGTGASYLETDNSNILLNSGFEHSTYSTGWTTAGTATYGAETSAPLSGLKSFKAVASSQTIDLSQTSTLYAGTLSNVQLFIKVVANNTASGVKLCSVKNSVVQSGSNDCITLATDGTRRTYELAFLGNGTNNGVSIAAPSTTGTLVVDEVKLSTDSKNFVDVGQIGPWIDAGAITITAVTSNPTKGTVVQDKLRYRINGENLELNFEYQQTSAGGADGSGVYLFAIPSGFTIDTTVFPANTTMTNDSLANDRIKVGDGTLTQNGGFLGSVGVYVYDSTRLYFKLNIAGDGSSTSINAISGNPFGSGTSPLAFSGNIGFRINASVKVQGLSNKITTYSQACTNDVQCENVFSAKVSSTGVVSGENLDWINGNAVITNTSTYTFTFNTDIFSVTPNCEVTFINTASDGQNLTPYIRAESNTAVAARIVNGTTAVAAASAFNISCTKSPPDFKAKNVITGSFQGIEKCEDPYDCTQVFSAKVSSTGVVSQENIDFINGNCSVSGTSVFTCSYISTLGLTTPLNCNANPEVATTDLNAHMRSSSTTGFVTWTGIASSGANDARDHIIICQKQGADFVPKTAVAGTYIDTNLSPGAGRVGLCSAKVSSTGVVTDQIGGCITTCTNANPRVCTFTSNYWQSGSVPNCNATSQLMGAAWASAVASTTTLSIYTANDVGASSPQATNFQCQGLLR